MPKSPLPGQPAPLPASFEAAMDELDALVERLESGQVPVDELLQGHQRAQALLSFCRDRLQAVESALLVETGGADGSAKTRPLEPADLRPAAGAGA